MILRTCPAEFSFFAIRFSPKTSYVYWTRLNRPPLGKRSSEHYIRKLSNHPRQRTGLAKTLGATMDGIHDMGGMHGFGPVIREENEPLFHDPWEGRVLAMTVATPIPVPGGSRNNIENMDPAHYLSSSYYEKWLHSRIKGLIDAGVLTQEELETRMALLRIIPMPKPRCIPTPMPSAQNSSARVLRLHPPQKMDIQPQFFPWRPRAIAQYPPHRAHPASPATHGANTAQSPIFTASTTSKTPNCPQGVQLANNPYMPCALTPQNCGVAPRKQKVPSIWTCGKATWSRRNQSPIAKGFLLWIMPIPRQTPPCAPKHSNRS